MVATNIVDGKKEKRNNGDKDKMSYFSLTCQKCGSKNWKKIAEGHGFYGSYTPAVGIVRNQIHPVYESDWLPKRDNAFWAEMQCMDCGHRWYNHD